MKILRSSIEPLEPRIAPASLNPAGTVLTYTDIDGDLVKVTFSKTVMEPSDFTFSVGGVSIGGDTITPQKLNYVDLKNHNGASMTVTATPQKDGNALKGDSHAGVKFIDATGTNLGSVTVDGDVQAIKAVELKSFSALSFGNGFDDNGLNVSQLSKVGNFSVKGDIAGHISLTVNGDVKSFTVGGSVGTLDAYQIQFNGNVGTLKIGGDIIGQATSQSLVVSGSVGTFTVGGSIIGSNSDLDSGTQVQLGQVKTITIGGDLRGKAGKGGGSIVVGSGTIGAVKIGGSVLGGDGLSSGVLSLNASVASITVGGNLQGGDGPASGNLAAKNVGAIKIGGSISGTAAGQGGGIVSADDVGSLTVGHDIISNFNSGFLLLRGKLNTLKIGGDIRCEDSPNPSTVAVISVDGVLGSFSVGGSITGDEAHVARILVGGVGAAPGTAALKSMTVKHSVLYTAIASGFTSSAGVDTARNAQAGLGSITIGGDMSGTYITSGGTVGGDGLIATHDDGLAAPVTGVSVAGIASLKIAGALTGLLSDSQEFLIYSRNIQKVTIGKATYTKAQLVAQAPHFNAIGNAAIICPG
jgi:hypothetical protein